MRICKRIRRQNALIREQSCLDELEDIRLFFIFQGIYICRMGKIIMPVLIFYKVVSKNAASSKMSDEKTCFGMENIMSKVSINVKDNIAFLNSHIGIKNSYDIVSREITIGGRNACMYLIDGFCKDEMMQKFLQFLMELKAEDMPKDISGMTQQFMPYVEVDVQSDFDQVIYFILAGTFALFIEGFDQCFLIEQELIPQEAWRNRRRTRR